MMKKALFVVPDGTGIKNYLFSDILPLLYANEVEVLVYHSLPEEAIFEIEKLHQLKLTQKHLSNFVETKKQKFYREAICYARLLHNAKLVNNKTILTNWNTNYTGIKKGFYKLLELYGSYLSKNYIRILKAEKKYQQLISTNLEDHITFLNNFKPSVVFCTHQRSLHAVPIIKAANQLGINTVGAIYSWDNLPKARLTVRTNEYVVWSDYMKKEIGLYYPEIKNSKIHVTGTPQFELYKNFLKDNDKSKFFEKHQLNINKKTICFSGDDVKTSPYDPQFLEHVAQAIVNSGKENEYQILFRRCPVDLSDRYDAILKIYKGVITPIAPQWSNTQQSWTQLYPFVADVKLLAHICKYSDVVINLGSTMALDFAYFKKPAIYLNYNPVVDKNWSVEMIYKFQHFRSMPSENAVYWIHNKEEIIAVIEQAMKSRNPLAEEWMNRINLPAPHISENITKILLK